MSAPWLVVPFVFGWTQVRARRAMLVGLVVTAAALTGYFALTLSPLEGVSVSRIPSVLPELVRSQLDYIVGGLVIGPLDGLLGQRWRVDRSWASAALVAGALCLEPAARLAVGRFSPPAVVWETEAVIGAAAAVFFLVAGLGAPSTRDDVNPGSQGRCVAWAGRAAAVTTRRRDRGWRRP